MCAHWIATYWQSVCIYKLHKYFFDFSYSQEGWRPIFTLSQQQYAIVKIASHCLAVATQLQVVCLPLLTKTAAN